MRELPKAIIQTNFTGLRTFFRWAVKRGYIQFSLMERLSAPIYRPDQAQHFTQTQVLALADAAIRTPTRDERFV